MSRASTLRALRSNGLLVGTVVLAGVVGLLAACGSSGSTLTVGEDAGSTTTNYGDGSNVILGIGEGGAGDDGGSGAVISNVTIVPANATLTVQAGQTVSQAYTVMGVVNGAGAPVDVTSRFVFWVPDNYLVGTFPTSGAPTFTSRLPVAATDPPQQGGTLTVEADALNPGSVPVKATTSLTVQLVATLDSTADGGVPADAGALFGGPNDSSRAPILDYPNDGVMLPPNLHLLDVHWMPGSPSNTLFQLTFTSATSSITYYTPCQVPGGPLVSGNGGLLASGACGFQLDPTGYAYLAQSNAGLGNVAVTIKGTDDAGTSVGTSATIHIQFAQQSVNGGVYYWDVTNTQIMRFDFGGTSTTPDVFFAPGQYGTGGTCVGCHAISPDGTKMVASEGGQNNGVMNYINDVATVAAPLTQTENKTNRVQFASFDPFGAQFVAVDGDGQMSANGSTSNNLFFHDGNTGLIFTSQLLSFEPDHPAWSPDGTMIAMTHVGSHNTSQREYLGGIDVATFAAGAVSDAGINVGDGGSALGTPAVVVPSNVTTATTAVNSYNPSFAPDSTFLVYSQTVCALSDSTNQDCDSDIADNVTATTWAIKPVHGATPIHLDNAAKPGVADGAGATILDTFPRPTPFETTQGTGKLFWFTVASLRQPGLRLKNWDSGENQQQLWMFAVDPAKILAGQDGSYPAFFLPFQNAKTSNHIAEWTQKIATSNPSPPPPPVPPPPPPPAPPPPK